MASAPKSYIIFALSLWSGVGALSGLTVGLLVGWHGRQLAFPIVVGVGVVWLVAVWLGYRGTQRYDVKRLPASVSRSVGSRRLQQSPGASPAQGVSKEILSEDEARQWLDDFLVRQQRNRNRE